MLFNIFYDYKKIWNFIFKYRYIIGILLFALLVACGVHTSSSGIYDSVIQPNHSNDLSKPFWGQIRPIRSDEFLAMTPAELSQALLGEFNDINPNIMGGNTSVLLFPKCATLSISVLANPYLLGFLFLDVVRGFSFYSLLQYFLAFFAVFEFLLILTKNNKILSLFGTCALVFSPPILWWNALNHLSYGCICLVLFYHLLKEKKILIKICLSLFIGWAGCCWIAVMYPAWLIPFGYLFLIFAIWFVILHMNNKSLLARNFLYLIPSLLIACIIFIPSILGSADTINLMTNTVYPGARDTIGGYGWQNNFYWFSSAVYTASNPGNPCEYSNFICLYPIPTIIGIYICIKNRINKKDDILLILLVVYSILLSIWGFIPIGIFSKISLLYMSMPERTFIVVGATNVFLIIRILNVYTTRNINKIKIILAIILTIITLCICSYVANYSLPGYYNGIIKIAIPSTIAILLIVTFVLNTGKTRTIFVTLMLSMSIFFAISINPLSSGLSFFYDKPVSKEIQNIVSNDKDSTWISANADTYFSNFALANNAKIINSVNFYPNMKYWKILDPDNKYDEIYNRYSHVNITLTNNDTCFELLQADSINVRLNINDMKKINIKYIFSQDPNLCNFNNENVELNNIYCEDGSYIYSVLYKTENNTTA